MREEAQGRRGNEHERELEECMKLLYDAAPGYESQRTSIPHPIEGTCKWFLEHPKFTQWKESSYDEPCFLWVTASPGCGKSVFANFLIDHLGQTGSSDIVCYFFFKDGDEVRQHLHHALCAILHQLLDRVPETNSLVQSTLKELRRKGKQFVKDYSSLWTILSTALQPFGSETPPRILFIVDALDECSEESRTWFINRLVSAFSEPGEAWEWEIPPKLLITSRPLVTVESELGPLTANCLRMEDEAIAISADIKKVVSAGIKKLRDERLVEERTCERVYQAILEKSGQDFLWVSLVLDLLLHSATFDDESVDDIINIPKDLDAVYESALSKTSDPDKPLTLLQILLVVTKPLHLDEVNVALHIRANDHVQTSISLDPRIGLTVKQLCGALVRIVDSRIHLAHGTVRTFLLKSETALPGPSRRWRGSVYKPRANYVLAQSCITYLALQDWTSDVSLGSRGAFYEYAALNWYVHVENATKASNDPEDINEAEKETLDECITTLCFNGLGGLRSWFAPFHRIGDWSFRVMLSKASAHGLVPVVRGMLRQTQEPSSSAKDWTPVPAFNPLHLAVLNGHDTVVRLLFAELGGKLGRYMTATTRASAREGHLAVVKVLFASEHCPQSAKDYALWEACRYSRLQVAEYAVSQGVSVEAKFDHKSALSVAVDREDHSMVTLLLNNKAVPTGSTILHAARWAETSLFRAILTAYENTDAALPDDWMSMATNEASSRGNAAVLNLLLDMGAKKPTQNNLDKGLRRVALAGDEVSIKTFIHLGGKDGQGAATYDDLMPYIEKCQSEHATQDSWIERIPEGQDLPVLLEKDFFKHKTAAAILDALLQSQKYDQRILCMSLETVFVAYLPKSNPPSKTAMVQMGLKRIPATTANERKRYRDFTVPVAFLLQRKARLSQSSYLDALGRAILNSAAIRKVCTELLLERVEEFTDAIPVSFAILLAPACFYNHSAAMSMLSKASTDVNKKDDNGVTPLLAATMANDLEVCERLLGSGADPNIVCSYEPKSRPSEDVPQEDDNTPRIYGDRGFTATPLAAAMKLNASEIMPLLLRHGADPWFDFCQGQEQDTLMSSIASAAQTEDSLDHFLSQLQKLNLLISSHINTREKISGRTLLHWAVVKRYQSSVEKLIALGADTEVKDANGATPLHEAAMGATKYTGSELVKYLVVQGGADLTAENNCGKTPLAVAIEAQGETDYLVETSGLPSTETTIGFLSRVGQFGYNRMDPAGIREAYEVSLVLHHAGDASVVSDAEWSDEVEEEEFNWDESDDDSETSEGLAVGER
ncbi:uncharacterized protein K452DRAFT_286912 [Aplosporella prunicola CBS 121167]|uniref:Uncharacterized protein n=1 Tax=Aplosporella prunicola CBS 121167 TaxID=1176127 RepID=A0A6A6BEA9_9PEZI|nr:uncharacterized protein K452DRAFT_286912 [Aplosporella prunicola CBS 121167]KAF2142499.1 hypothetical protein K452DRAFT_286912 [Aplosporella prunicola CBS 121167]